MNFRKDEIIWKEGLIVKLYIKFISKEPKYFLVTEIMKKWIALAVMTSDNKLNSNKYTIVNEKIGSKFHGSLINYNTILIIGKHYDLTNLYQKTYKGRRIISPNYLLNRLDFETFKKKQRDYFYNPKHQKHFSKIIYAFSMDYQEEWMPSYLKKK